jgi:hypothetical protein
MVQNTGKASVVALTRTSPWRVVALTRVGVGVGMRADAGGAVVQAIEASVDLYSIFFSSLRNSSDGRKK